MRTLIADDDSVCRALLTRVLSDFGAVTATTDGVGAIAETARALAEKQPYDLVCLDIMMPVLDGQRCLEVIRRLEDAMGTTTAKVAMISALDDKVNILGAFRNQADLYFPKPIDFAKILHELRKAQLIPNDQ
jgi:two-component system, chemotaxis family, chemotaxis protein CheY